ncbi:aminotransferase class III-fold pyridoxal phosphate-dependent enzyme [Crocosphaera watsonii]|uniref:Glutamate-1-semialdehyde aminotransferase n=1 Tax=Crocosphaera watsonii WH 0401 TaxID=555881 RepID=T2J3M1_CROWT|nr:aminotransferase class III-fold pyridoxal phosphate-dependent enzyme [Crocosphaera watsonii]CCQ59835.1 Glutamate-1-semialdehyde aminotransferase [Crocosphaera watsonii WH 0401]
MSDRYISSEELLQRSLKTIPLGTQTYSKSKTHYPYGVSPYFITHGQGSHVWDVDGHEYIDFVNALTAITLGYNDPDVNQAVIEQMTKGTIFSLPHPIEIEVAEKIVEMVPGAEMVRFGKNGSDATSAAIRLARAYTKRDRIARCGYHGWHDWYIGSTSKHLGIPEVVRELTHSFSYNNIDSLEQIFQQYPDQIAAVILEPMNIVEPQPGFLEQLKEITHEQGAILIFDETITGFRFAQGGAQEYFNVIPDLATFGKGLANGFPLSAITGRAEIMALMEEVFFSFTFGGETLSLTAALTTMNKLQREPVIETMTQQGNKVLEGVKNLIKQHNIEHILSVSGHPVWSFILFKEVSPYSQYQIKTLFLQEMFIRGILTIGTHNMSYAHQDKDIARLLTAYQEVFSIIDDAVNNCVLEKYLQCQPLEPLFKGMSRN